MAATTTNYGLKKPGENDFYNISDFNENADKIDAALIGKVDKIPGKGLSSNDYTSAEKSKVANIAGKPGTGTNSEIHNDTSNNKAKSTYSYAEGYKTSAFSNLFNVLSISGGNNDILKLNTVSGLAVGQRVLLYDSSNSFYGSYWTISSISTENMTVKINTSCAYTPKLMLVIGSPDFGDITNVSGPAYQTFSRGGEHAEGYVTTAVGKGAHSGGSNSHAIGETAFAHGKGIISLIGSWFGSYNKPVSGTLLGIGNGTSDTARTNAFRVKGDGKVYAQGAYNSTGADYAEMFEWKDANANNEDRRGLFVTLDGDKIRAANDTDDYILGIVSSNPGVVGNNYSDHWQGMYMTDIWGEVMTDDENNPLINPEYDADKEYISRESRAEWGCIGLMGQLVVIDDGTCKANGYCKSSAGGIATAADTGYRVMKRIDEKHVLILFK